jgi:hypothetical protein
MPCNSIISEKCEYYKQYILNNNLYCILFDPFMPNKYSLDVYLNIYFLFQKTGISLDMFYELFDYASYIGSGNYPKRTSLHTFKNKISKIEIHKAIHHEYINKNNIITNDCLIDSVIIPNKNNTLYIGTYNYKGKKGAKITHITNDIGYPLIASIDASNNNDAVLGANIIANNIDILKTKNVTILGDKGYDSKIIRDILSNNQCSSIIPKNNRREDSIKNKEIKKAVRDKINKKRIALMKKQKRLNIKKREILKNNTITNEELDKIISEIDNDIRIIKNNRKRLPIKLKQNIKKEIDKTNNEINNHKCNDTKNNRKCAFCKFDTVCNKCAKCTNCNKILSYYTGLTDEEIYRYKKRIRVEHFINHYKSGRTSNVKDRIFKMLEDTVYNRYTDFIFIKKITESQII